MDKNLGNNLRLLLKDTRMNKIKKVVKMYKLEERYKVREDDIRYWKSKSIKTKMNTLNLLRNYFKYGILSHKGGGKVCYVLKRFRKGHACCFG